VHLTPSLRSESWISCEPVIDRVYQCECQLGIELSGYAQERKCLIVATYSNNYTHISLRQIKMQRDTLLITKGEDLTVGYSKYSLTRNCCRLFTSLLMVLLRLRFQDKSPMKRLRWAYIGVAQKSCELTNLFGRDLNGIVHDGPNDTLRAGRSGKRSKVSIIGVILRQEMFGV